MAEMFKITYDDSEARVFLQNLKKNIETVAEPLQKSARFMENEARANFPARGSTFGEKWPGWAESTRKVRLGEISFRTVHKPYKRVIPVSPQPGDKGGKLMEKTGTLKGGFRTMGPVIGKDTASIEVHNPVEYAKYHQTEAGATLWTGAKLPRRVLLKLVKRQIDEIRRIFEEWLGGAIQKSAS